MKPEPLKDKEQAIIGSPKRIFSEGFNTPCFHKEDIKSAVEWLKEKIEPIWRKYNTDIGVYTETNKAIDKAFEDVTKGVQPKKQ